MPSKKITQMDDLAGAQVPGDLVALVDLSEAPADQNVKSTLTDFFANVPVPVSIQGSNPTLNLIDTDPGDDDASISLAADTLGIAIASGPAISIAPTEISIAAPNTEINQYVQINNTGKVQTRAGVGPTPSANQMALAGIFYRQLTQASTAGSTIEVSTGFVLELGQNVMGEDGDIAVAHLWGNCADAAGSPYDPALRVYFDGLVRGDNPFGQNSDPLNQHWHLMIHAMRISSVAAQLIVELNWSRFGQTISNNGGAYQVTDQFTKLNAISPTIAVANWTASRQIGVTMATGNAARNMTYIAGYAVKYPVYT